MGKIKVICPKCGKIFEGWIREAKWHYAPKYVTCRINKNTACYYISLTGPNAPPYPKKKKKKKCLTLKKSMWLN